MKETTVEIIKICDRHADRLNWAMTQLQKHIPFTGQTLKQINDVELAILDQFSTRFAKLQLTVRPFRRPVHQISQLRLDKG